MGNAFRLTARVLLYAPSPTDRIAHTTAFVTPVVEHWLERSWLQVHDTVSKAVGGSRLTGASGWSMIYPRSIHVSEPLGFFLSLKYMWHWYKICTRCTYFKKTQQTPQKTTTTQQQTQKTHTNPTTQQEKNKNNITGNKRSYISYKLSHTHSGCWCVYIHTYIHIYIYIYIYIFFFFFFISFFFIYFFFFLH